MRQDLSEWVVWLILAAIALTYIAATETVTGTVLVAGIASYVLYRLLPQQQQWTNRPATTENDRGAGTLDAGDRGGW